MVTGPVELIKQNADVTDECFALFRGEQLAVLEVPGGDEETGEHMPETFSPLPLLELMPALDCAVLPVSPYPPAAVVVLV